jgi:hypothetical protein
VERILRFLKGYITLWKGYYAFKNDISHSGKDTTLFKRIYHTEERILRFLKGYITQWKGYYAFKKDISDIGKGQSDLN